MNIPNGSTDQGPTVPGLIGEIKKIPNQTRNRWSLETVGDRWEKGGKNAKKSKRLSKNQGF